MTYEDFLTMPLHKRVEWLRKRAGSHDKLAAELGTTRQTVIGWEKGAQPNADYRGRLAEVSGYPADAFRRSASEQEVWALTESRLRATEALAEEARSEARRAIALVREIELSLRGRQPPSGDAPPPSQASEV